MSANPDSVANQGPFQSHVPPSKPLTTEGHAISTKVGNRCPNLLRQSTYIPSRRDSLTRRPKDSSTMSRALPAPNHPPSPPRPALRRTIADNPLRNPQTLHPGSVPADRTFQPNPTSDTPSQANNDDTLRADGKESTSTSASSTLDGATSQDVYTGLGKPMQG